MLVVGCWLLVVLPWRNLRENERLLFSVPTKSSVPRNLKGCQKVAGGKAAGRHPRKVSSDQLDPGGVVESSDIFPSYTPTWVLIPRLTHTNVCPLKLILTQRGKAATKSSSSSISSSTSPSPITRTRKDDEDERFACPATIWIDTDRMQNFNPCVRAHAEREHTLGGEFFFIRVIREIRGSDWFSRVARLVAY